MAYLTGTFHHKVDEKGRVSFPASFRKVLSTSLMVSLAPTKDHLIVHEPEAFEAWVKGVIAEKSHGETRLTDPRIQKLQRLLNAQAVPVEVDKAGRIGLKAEQRDKVGITGDVYLIGNGDHVEVWDVARWDETNSLDDEFDDLFFN